MNDTPVWMGCESEYAVTGTGSAVGRGRFGRALLRFMKSKLEWLPDYSPYGFMSPWGRCYIDAGAHPEFSTTPCSNPWDMLDALQYFQSLAIAFSRKSCNRFYLTRCNIDYLGKTTWGQHDCYGIEGRPVPNPKCVIPFLVSRCLFAGAGGFRIVKEAPHVTFCLSPRSQFVNTVIGQTQFPIWHVKCEPSLASRTRVHIMAGENLVSNWALALKLTTTALVIKLAAEDPSAFSGMPVLADPVQALKDISNVWWSKGSCPIKTMDGSWIEAVAIQRYYAKLVRDRSDRSYLPPYSRWLSEHWLDILDSLEAGVTEVYADRGKQRRVTPACLDWVAKRDLFEQCLQSNGGYTLTDLNKKRVPPELVFRLLRLDTEWGKLTDDSLGEQWSRQDKVKCPHVTICNVPQAPLYPVKGLPKQRGDAIRELSRKEDKYICLWHSITAKQTGEVVYRFNERSLGSPAEGESILNNLDNYILEACGGG